MENTLKIYASQMPSFIKQYLETAALQRLKGIEMNCGLQFTSHPDFSHYESYSRYVHSVGVALIIWNFTHDEPQTLAGLFHDISTMAFSHVIDFVKNDYLHQEATEIGTREVIIQDSDLMRHLQDDGICVDDICNYHQYPIADNHSPQLAADRLEYTFGSLWNYRIRSVSDLQQYFSDITVGINEFGQSELMFQHTSVAKRFARDALVCGKIYSADFDRYAMEYLATILRNALQAYVISENDLYRSEAEVVEILRASDLNKMWQRYTRLYAVKKCTDGDMIVDVKKRYIDPYVQGKGRVSHLSKDFYEEVQSFLRTDYRYRMKGIYRDE